LHLRADVLIDLEQLADPEAVSYYEESWGIKPWIWPDIEIDAAILKPLFQRRIETLDNMKVDFRKPLPEARQHLR
jgi:hypothetical protein